MGDPIALCILILKLILITTIPQFLSFVPYNLFIEGALTGIVIVLIILPLYSNYCINIPKIITTSFFLLLSLIVNLIIDTKVLLFIGNNYKHFYIFFFVYFWIKQITLFLIIIIKFCLYNKKTAQDNTINVSIESDEIISINIDPIDIIKIDESDNKCPICLEQYDETNNISKLGNCNHVFHETCINIWIKKNQTCPNCRKTVIY